jgi:hypothetical protein
MIGKRIWLPVTIASGKMTAQALPGILHPIGTRLVERTTINPSMKKLMTSDNQKRRNIRGTSMKKLDFSTSFLVALHEMLYEKRCARRAWDRWIDKPPKKKKLCASASVRNRTIADAVVWHLQEWDPGNVLNERIS